MANNQTDEIVDLPLRIFASGEEPHGQRVNSYLKPNRISSILNALTPSEVKILRESTFGKLISTAEEPPFSGAFGQYIITRMLYVRSKHEIWFLFAGFPIRVSLREFAIVTGLPCGKFPKINKKKKRVLVKEKKYWGELFGKFESLTVDAVVKLLKKRIVRDSPRRIKYAFLALTAAVLCPSSHYPKILDEHVELIRDLDQFLAYPWGRVSFEMVVASIKARDVVGLAQKSIAVQGFFHAFQLVMVKAVPALLEVVEVCQSSSESESGSDLEDEARNQLVNSLGEANPMAENVEDDANDCREDDTGSTPNTPNVKVSLSPSHARDIDEKCLVHVNCIIPSAPGMDLDEALFSWSDDEEDGKVKNMVRLIGEGFHFSKTMFKGGATAADIERMRKDRKEAKENKDKDKGCQRNEGVGTIDCNLTADNLVAKLKPYIDEVDLKVSSCLTRVMGVEASVSQCLSEVKQLSRDVDRSWEISIDGAVQSIKETVIAAVLKALSSSVAPDANVPAGSGNVRSVFRRTAEVSQHRSLARHVEVNNQTDQDIVNQVLGEVNESLAENPPDGQSLNNGQETSESGDNQALPAEIVCDDHDDDGDGEDQRRKSKRLRAFPNRLDGFQCPTLVSSRAAAHPLLQGILPDQDYEAKYGQLVQRLKSNRMVNVSNGSQISIKDVIEIGERGKVLSPKVVDALIHFSRILIMRAVPGPESSKTRFFDTKFVASFMKHYTKFSKVAAKDRGRFVFQDQVLQIARPVFTVLPIPERIYFPFFVDKSYWVGLSVDIRARSIQVLDCNIPLRSDSLMKKDLNPIASMLPFLIKAATTDPMFSSEGVFSLERPKGVPHNPVPADSAVATILMILAHSMVGFEGVKCITPEVLPLEARRFAVVFYEEFGGSI